jgi:hypothetical protein
MAMKTYGVAAILVASGCAVGACSSGEKGDASRTLELALDGEGENMRLSSAPGNPLYTATYPNIQNLKKMTVTTDRHGSINSTCITQDDKTVECEDTPFFATTVKADNVTTVTVYDLNGEPCGDQVFVDGEGTDDGESDGVPSSSSNGSAEGADEECGGDGTGSGTDSGSGSTSSADAGSSTKTDSGTKSDSGSSSSDSGTKTDSGTKADSGTAKDAGGGSGGKCDETKLVAARDAFCGKLNTWLKSHGFNESVDCTKLDNNVYTKQPAPVKGWKVAHCVEIWGKPYEEAKATVGDCKIKSRIQHWKDQARYEMIHDGVCRSSPLVLDLDGDGVNLSSVDNGVSFDLMADGTKVKASWTDGKDAFLVLDRNSNGTIDGAGEMFGNTTNGFADGFAALSAIDSNADGVIDSKDPAFGELQAWRDFNRDGVSTPNELSSLREVGVKRLLVGAIKADEVSSWDKHGNNIPLVSGFVRNDGSRGLMVDAWLRYKAR